MSNLVLHEQRLWARTGLAAACDEVVTSPAARTLDTEREVPVGLVFNLAI